MKAGVTIFYINRGEYIYRESGGNRVYTTTISNSGRGIESRLKKNKREDEEDDHVDIFSIIQKNPNTSVHLKVEEAMEGCREK